MRSTNESFAKASASPASRNRGTETGITTHPQTHPLIRSLALGTGALLGPAALGIGLAALLKSRRAGWIAGGISFAVLAAARWQLQRLFTNEPAYVVERRVGHLEIRRYEPRVEARIHVEETDFEKALDRGFHLLAAYIFGGNDTHEKLAMTTPVITMRDDGGHLMSFVMPVGRTRESLPRPNDKRVTLIDVPEERVVVLRKRARYSNDSVREQAQRLRELARQGNLVTRGEPMFAGFDPPSTAPWLRRSEVWLELV